MAFCQYRGAADSKFQLGPKRETFTIFQNMQIIQNGHYDVIGKHISLVLFLYKQCFFIVLVNMEVPPNLMGARHETSNFFKICKSFKMATMTS